MPEYYQKYVDETYVFEHNYHNIMLTEELKDAISRKEPYIFQSAPQLQSLAVNVWSHGKHLATFQMDAVHHGIRPSDHSIAYILGKALEKAVTENGEINYSLSSSFEKAILNMLEQRPVLSAEIDNVLKGRGWSANDLFVCMVIESDSNDSSTNTLFLTGEAIVQQFSDAVYVIHEDYIVMICRKGSMLDNEYMASLERISAYAQESGLRIGISNDYNRFDMLYAFFENALSALKSLIKEGNNQRVTYFDNCLLSALHKTLEKTCGITPLMPSYLLHLMEYDRVFDTDYVHFLKALLDHHMSPTETASATYLHRNTVMKRISTLREKFHVPLDNSAQCNVMALMLAFMET